MRLCSEFRSLCGLNRCGIRRLLRLNAWPIERGGIRRHDFAGLGMTWEEVGYCMGGL